MLKKIMKIGIIFSAGLFFGSNLGNAQSGASSNTCRGSCWIYDANGSASFFRSFTCRNIYSDSPNSCFWAHLDQCTIPSGVTTCAIDEHTNCSRVRINCTSSGTGTRTPTGSGSAQ